MADQRADIDAALFAERIEIIADQLPGHIDAGFQHRQRDLLGVGEKFEIPLAVARPHRRDDLAALADDDRRVAVMHPRAAPTLCEEPLAKMRAEKSRPAGHQNSLL